MTDYPPNMTLRPLERWPRDETRNRVRAPFRSGWGDTMNVLHLELRKLGTDGPVWTRASFAPSILQIALREQDFRLNALPRANSIPSMPGVILNVESNKGPLSFPCDKFDRWTDNLRAITLGLEALRKVDRYGITPGNEQYRGWQAIESAPTLDAKKAACVLLARIAWPNENDEHQANWAPKIATDAEIGRNTYRQARAKAHPDRHNGDQYLWDQVEQAAAIIGLTT